ncbi:MAG: hypothetical protein GXP49_07565 [Deltaproteobacteria bacterium]|nr:hypothetical protein [Deltaproteobacteria bacterium]
MKLFLAFLLILAMAIWGSDWVISRLGKVTHKKRLMLAGIEFLLAGILLGDHALGLLDKEVLNQLSPLSALVLGGIGFLCGADIELKRLRIFPSRFFKVALVQSVTTFVLVFALVGGALALFRSMFPAVDILMFAFAVAALAITSSPAVLAFCRNVLERSRDLDLFIFVTGLDGLLAIFVFSIPFSSRLPAFEGVQSWLGPLIWVAGSVAIGALLGLTLHILARFRCSQDELVLFIMGVVVLSAGVSSRFGICSLLVNASAGIVAANLEPAGARIRRAMVSMERPMYIALLILAGASIRLDSTWPIFMAVVYMASRIPGKFAGVWLGSALVREKTRTRAGVLLVPQGGVALAMALSMVRAFPGAASDGLLLFVILAFLVQEILATRLAQKIFLNDKEKC